MTPQEFFDRVCEGLPEGYSIQIKLDHAGYNVALYAPEGGIIPFKGVLDFGRITPLTLLEEVSAATTEAILHSAEDRQNVPVTIKKLYSLQDGNICGAEVVIVSQSGREYLVQGKFGGPDYTTSVGGYVKYIDSPIQEVRVYTPNTIAVIDSTTYRSE